MTKSNRKYLARRGDAVNEHWLGVHWKCVPINITVFQYLRHNGIEFRWFAARFTGVSFFELEPNVVEKRPHQGRLNCQYWVQRGVDTWALLLIKYSSLGKSYQFWGIGRSTPWKHRSRKEHYVRCSSKRPKSSKNFRFLMLHMKVRMAFS